MSCRDYYKKPAAIALWLLCELAIVACDLAEVVGSAVALQAAVPHPPRMGRPHHRSRRPAPAPGLYAVRLPQDRGDHHHPRRDGRGLLPFRGAARPSGLVRRRPGDLRPFDARTRRRSSSPSASSARRSCRITSTCTPASSRRGVPSTARRALGRRSGSTRSTPSFALSFAFFVNAAILILAAAAFRSHRPSSSRSWSRGTQLLGIPARGGVGHRVRRRPARGGAILHDHRHPRGPDRDGGLPPHQASNPGSAASSRAPLPSCPRSSSSRASGGKGTVDLLVLSQVVLSMQLPFAIFPLIMVTSDRETYGRVRQRPLGQGRSATFSASSSAASTCTCCTRPSTAISSPRSSRRWRSSGRGSTGSTRRRPPPDTLSPG